MVEVVRAALHSGKRPPVAALRVLRIKLVREDDRQLIQLAIDGQGDAALAIDDFALYLQPILRKYPSAAGT